MGKLFFLNNCQGYDHARLYEDGAFYDLNLTGRQATMATDIVEGDKCVVATRNPDEDHGPYTPINFSWFSFSHEDVCRTKKGTQIRVFFGKWLKSEQLPKNKAAAIEPYSIFFNINGHFKRPSVINTNT